MLFLFYSLPPVIYIKLVYCSADTLFQWVDAVTFQIVGAFEITAAFRSTRDTGMHVC